MNYCKEINHFALYKKKQAKQRRIKAWKATRDDLSAIMAITGAGVLIWITIALAYTLGAK
jgi:hypothetical protein